MAFIKQVTLGSTNYPIVPEKVTDSTATYSALCPPITSNTTIEIQANKVTSISASSTDNQYPTAKAVYDALPVLSGNATTADVLSGDTFYSSSSTQQTGTMGSVAGGSYNPSSSTRTIASGKYLSSDVIIQPCSGTTKCASSNTSYNVVGKAYASVCVPLPSGSITVTTNGNHNVYSYATVNVNVSAPSGTTIIQNDGTYNVSTYSSASVNVNYSGGRSITAAGSYNTQHFTTVTVSLVTNPSSSSSVGWTSSSGVSYTVTSSAPASSYYLCITPTFSTNTPGICSATEKRTAAGDKTAYINSINLIQGNEAFVITDCTGCTFNLMRNSYGMWVY